MIISLKLDGWHDRTLPKTNVLPGVPFNLLLVIYFETLKHFPSLKWPLHVTSITSTHVWGLCSRLAYESARRQTQARLELHRSACSQSLLSRRQIVWRASHEWNSNLQQLVGKKNLVKDGWKKQFSIVFFKITELLYWFCDYFFKIDDLTWRAPYPKTNAGST